MCIIHRGWCENCDVGYVLFIVLTPSLRSTWSAWLTSIPAWFPQDTRSWASALPCFPPGTGSQCVDRRTASHVLYDVLCTPPWPSSVRSCRSGVPRVLKQSLLILHISKAEALLLASLPQPTFYAVSHSGPGSGWSYSHGAACPKPPQPQTPTPLSFVIKWGNRLIFSESFFY